MGTILNLNFKLAHSVGKNTIYIVHSGEILLLFIVLGLTRWIKIKYN